LIAAATTSFASGGVAANSKAGVRYVHGEPNSRRITPSIRHLGDSFTMRLRRQIDFAAFGE
jgi:hypothetical protein